MTGDLESRASSEELAGDLADLPDAPTHAVEPAYESGTAFHCFSYSPYSPTSGIPNRFIETGKINKKCHALVKDPFVGAMGCIHSTLLFSHTLVLLCSKLALDNSELLLQGFMRRPSYIMALVGCPIIVRLHTSPLRVTL